MNFILKSLASLCLKAYAGIATSKVMFSFSQYFLTYLGILFATKGISSLNPRSLAMKGFIYIFLKNSYTLKKNLNSRQQIRNTIMFITIPIQGKKTLTVSTTISKTLLNASNNAPEKGTNEKHD